MEGDAGGLLPSVRVYRRRGVRGGGEWRRSASVGSASEWLPRATPRCSTMENAKLGDSMVERLRAEGTAAEKEKEDAMSA